MCYMRIAILCLWGRCCETQSGGRRRSNGRGGVCGRKLWNLSWHLALAAPGSSWLSTWPVGEVPPLSRLTSRLLEGLELGGSVMSPPLCQLAPSAALGRFQVSSWFRPRSRCRSARCLLPCLGGRGEDGIWWPWTGATPPRPFCLVSPPPPRP